MYSVMESNKQIQLLASNPHPFYEGNKPQKVNYEKFYLLSRRSVTGIVKMVSVLNYYSRKRLWLTDLYYVLK